MGSPIKRMTPPFSSRKNKFFSRFSEKDYSTDRPITQACWKGRKIAQSTCGNCTDNQSTRTQKGSREKSRRRAKTSSIGVDISLPCGNCKDNQPTRTQKGSQEGESPSCGCRAAPSWVWAKPKKRAELAKSRRRAKISSMGVDISLPCGNCKDNQSTRTQKGSQEGESPSCGCRAAPCWVWAKPKKRAEHAKSRRRAKTSSMGVDISLPCGNCTDNQPTRTQKGSQEGESPSCGCRAGPCCLVDRKK